MRKLLIELWKDDGGALIATEWLFVATIMVIGLVTGLVAVRNAVTNELGEFANAVMALSQGFSFEGLVLASGDHQCAATDGSQAIDTPSVVNIVGTPPAIPSVIDLLPCD